MIPRHDQVTELCCYRCYWFCMNKGPSVKKSCLVFVQTTFYFNNILAYRQKLYTHYPQMDSKVTASHIAKPRGQKQQR